MTQKERGEYEMDIKGIDESTLLETGHRQYEMLKVIARILLDIREVFGSHSGVKEDALGADINEGSK